MQDQFERTRLLVGDDAMRRLRGASVAVFGIGGVGGFCTEALARMGVGAIDLYDNDKISMTNLNRQIVALHSTIGLYKVDVMADRIREINPDCAIRTFRLFYLPDNSDKVDLSVYDYVIDAIDTVTSKVELIVRAKAAGVRIICAMGAANKMDPTQFAVMDIHKTETDPLARVMRKELRARGIQDVKVVCSKEPPQPSAGAFHGEEVPEVSADTGVPSGADEPAAGRNADNLGKTGPRQIPASNAFVPPVCGLILAGEVVKDLISGDKGNDDANHARYDA